MARRRSRRLSKPLLPGFWSVLVALMLIGSVAGVFWLAGRSVVVRKMDVEKTEPLAKR